MPTHTNPFPGMNPYFQEYWSDVHTSLITYIRDSLAHELPEDLSARAEERIVVEGDSEPREYRADVTVAEPFTQGFPDVWQPEGSEAATITVAEPLVFLEEHPAERWLEIRDTDGRLVTVIEVLSPSNKSDVGFEKYRKKQSDFIDAGVVLVEIDFIRSGRQATALPSMLKFPHGTCYHVCVARPYIRGLDRREVYLCPLREPLPTIRVPLRRGDRDVPLVLQQLMEKCFQNGRYWQKDYSGDPHPPVAPEDAAWVDERLRAEGLRQ